MVETSTLHFAQRVDERLAPSRIPPARVFSVEAFRDFGKPSRKQDRGLFNGSDVSPQLFIGVNPGNPIGTYRRVDLPTANRVFHPDDEHSGTRLRQPPARVELECIDRIAKSIEFLDNNAKIAPAVRRSQSANVFKNDRPRRSRTHLLQDVHKAEKRLGLSSPHKPFSHAG